MRAMTLAMIAIAVLLVGAIYLLIGTWLGIASFLGPIGASFILGTLFVICGVVPQSWCKLAAAGMVPSHCGRSNA